MYELPLDWEWGLLEEHIEFAQNGFGRRPNGIENGPIVLRIADVSSGFIDLSNPRHIEMSDQEFENYKIHQGDLIFIRVNGSLDLVARSIPVKKKYKNIAFNDHLIRVKLKADLDQDYLHEITNLGWFRSRILSSIPTASGGQLTINQSNLGKLRIPLPPIIEQRKIAEILRTWDTAIELVEKQIEAKQRLKKGLMQQLLTGKMRFPGFEEEWRKYKVGNIADLTAGGTPSTSISKYWNGNIRWMKSGEIHQKRIFEVENRITQKGLENSSAKILPVNSVLIALAGQGKTRGTVAINKVELSTNQSVAAMMPNEELINYEFLYYILDARYEELRKLSTGDGGRGGLNLKLLRSIKLLAPSLAEQKRIVQTLTAFEQAILKLEEKAIVLRKQKQGLMQKLLTGKVRVNV